MKLWSRGKMSLKKRDTDERIFFGKFDGGTRERAPGPILPTQPAEVIITAPTHAPGDTVWLVAAQFGKYGSISEIPQTAHQVFAKTTHYSVCYEATDSAVIAHGAVFEVSMGEITVVGNPDLQCLDHLYAQQPDNSDEHPEDPKWWRFELGKMHGSTDAITEQSYRFTATNLATNAEYMEAWMSHHHLEISLQDNDPLPSGIGTDASVAMTVIFLFRVWLWPYRTPPRTTFRPRVALIRRVMRIRTKIMEAWVRALTYWCFITSVGAPLPSPPPPEPTRQSLRSGNRVKGYKHHKWHLAHMHWVCIVLVTLVHIQTAEYQYTAQGPRAASPHIPQWKSMVYIPVHMLWDIGA